MEESNSSFQRWKLLRLLRYVSEKCSSCWYSGFTSSLVLLGLFLTFRNGPTGYGQFSSLQGCVFDWYCHFIQRNWLQVLEESGSDCELFGHTRVEGWISCFLGVLYPGRQYLLVIYKNLLKYCLLRPHMLILVLTFLSSLPPRYATFGL